jgi:hypothetical protein
VKFTHCLRKHIPVPNEPFVIIGKVAQPISFAIGSAELFPPEGDHHEPTGKDTAYLLQQLASVQSVNPAFCGSDENLVKTEPETPPAKALRAALDKLGLDSSVKGVKYGTDTPKTSTAGAPSVVFDPGDIAQAQVANSKLDRKLVPDLLGS